MTRDRLIKNTLLGAGAAVLLTLGAAFPAQAVAQSTSWNYSAPGCTQTTINGANDVLNGGLGGVSGSTSRSQDICSPGTAYVTGVDVRVGSSIAPYTTTNRVVVGSNSGNVKVLTGGTRHYYQSSSRSLAAAW